MKSYQKQGQEVKERIKVIDGDILLEKAIEGLLILSIELGFEALRQIIENVCNDGTSYQDMACVS